ncbi:alpha/beta fold hydrolase [Alkalihalobacterium alkalinitrilicum]|uniref:alpha/beta fold hydrolase n=1 Tax=Alkalihalobacterium alkalinitrilicum TaxID=427920 RepID=UPI00114D5E41|nr:alpha/beta hydrolase [Alkalihalobacterium alkalinitrilicum]
MLYYTTYERSPKHSWLVLIHGLGGNSNIWYKQIDEYKKSYNVLLVDLCGHGKSKDKYTTVAHYTFAFIAKEVLKVLDYLDIKSAHFVGISLGTIVNHNIAIISPERVETLTQAGAALKFNRRCKLLLMIGDIGKKIIPYMWLYSFFAYIIMPNKQHEKSRSIFIKEAKKLGKTEFIKWFNIVKKETEQSYLSFLKLKKNFPTLYVSGVNDHMFIDFIKKEIPEIQNCKLLILDKCGHVCNIEGSKQFNEISLAFFKKYSDTKEEVSKCRKAI